MQTMHTIHIRGPQPMFFLFRENQSIPLFTQLRFYFFKSTFMFFSRKEKNHWEKKLSQPTPRIDILQHADSACLRNHHGFLTTIFL